MKRQLEERLVREREEALKEKEMLLKRAREEEER